MAKKRSVKLWLVWWELPPKVRVTTASTTFKMLYSSHKTYTPFVNAAKKLGWEVRHAKGVWSFIKGNTACNFDGERLKRLVGNIEEVKALHDLARKLSGRMLPKDISASISRAIRVYLYGVNIKNRSSCYIIPVPSTVGTNDAYTTLQQEVETVGFWHRLEVEVKHAEIREVLGIALKKEYEVIQDNFTGNKFKEMYKAWQKKLEIFGDLCDLDLQLISTESLPSE